MEESNKRVIKVNPDLFKIPDSTRKKTPKAPKNKEIKVKSNHEKNKSIKKKLLNFIRTKQQNLLKDRVNTNHNVVTSSQNFHDEFQESLDYLSQLVEDDEKPPVSHAPVSHAPVSHTPVSHTPVSHAPVLHAPVSHNSTIKNYHPYENVNIDFPENLQSVNTSTLQTNPTAPPIQISQPPKYGCLKNGHLPTFRNWRNQTQKIHTHQPETNAHSTNSASITPIQLSTIKQTQNILNSTSTLETTCKKKPKYLKKIKRRRFTIGRSKTHPKVAVLVSNKTMRKQIDTKKALLQQTPIQEVKKFLIKNGFIKVGSVAPNSMLRKMYETVSMICGNVTNHNSRNLLYNYFHYNE